MTPEAIIAIIALAISVFFSIPALILSILSRNDSKKASQVSTELLIQQLISATRKDLHDFAYTISDKKTEKLKKQLLASYMEQELNVYDVACASYLDKKIDRKRFKKTYSTEIRNLFEKSDDMKKLLDKDGRYWAIKKVYEEWFNVEK